MRGWWVAMLGLGALFSGCVSPAPQPPVLWFELRDLEIKVETNESTRLGPGFKHTFQGRGTIMLRDQDWQERTVLLYFNEYRRSRNEEGNWAEEDPTLKSVLVKNGVGKYTNYAYSRWSDKPTYRLEAVGWTELHMADLETPETPTASGPAAE